MGFFFGGGEGGKARNTCFQIQSTILSHCNKSFLFPATLTLTVRERTSPLNLRCTNSPPSLKTLSDITLSGARITVSSHSVWALAMIQEKKKKNKSILDGRFLIISAIMKTISLLNENDQFIGCAGVQDRTWMVFKSYLSANATFHLLITDHSLWSRTYYYPVLAWWPSSERSYTSLSYFSLNSPAAFTLYFICLAVNTWLCCFSTTYQRVFK